MTRSLQNSSSGSLGDVGLKSQLSCGAPMAEAIHCKALCGRGTHCGSQMTVFGKQNSGLGGVGWSGVVFALVSRAAFPVSFFKALPLSLRNGC